MIQPDELWQSRRAWGAAGLLLLAGFLVLSRIALPEDRFSTICFFRLSTGVPCPGCGLTRSFSALAKFDPIGALRYHPLGPLLAIESVGLWIYWGGIALARRRPPKPKLVNGFLIAHAVLLIAVWLIRLAWWTG